MLPFPKNKGKYKGYLYEKWLSYVLLAFPLTANFCFQISWEGLEAVWFS